MRRFAFCLLLLASEPAAAASVNVGVDLNANVHAFSPLIFGVAFGDPARNAQIGYTVDRWGGNSTTRYNWQTDVANHTSDYYFENIANDAVSCAGSPANSADAFIHCARAAGARALMTVPTIGWTPRADSPTAHPYFAGFSVAKYGAQIAGPYGAAAVDPYDTDAGGGYCDPNANTTGYCIDGQIVGNDPTDTSTASTAADAVAWVAHLQAQFGTAASGGVPLYALDNEVMLWNSTHRDVHPAPATYDEIWNKTVAYASAIKQQDAAAQITGPVTWGYCDLFGSAADSCVDGADRQAHGGVPFVAWYLQQVCAYQQMHAIRLIDYVDLHWYPQDPNGASGSIYSNDQDSATVGRRLRSLRELYDPAWVSQAWIADLGDDATWHYSKPNLIPRVKAWIDQYCPGTRLAITEYAWDQDNTASGAVAQAELFGIFAREGVDLATRWVAPAAGSRVEQAFSLFLNYDGAGGKVVGDSVAATSANIDQIGAYAFVAAGRQVMVLLTNKDSVSHDITVNFNAMQSGDWKLYGFSTTQALGLRATGHVASTALTLSALAPMSANLLVIGAPDGIFRNGFE